MMPARSRHSLRPVAAGWLATGLALLVAGAAAGSNSSPQAAEAKPLIAFASYRDVTSGAEVWVMNTDGSGQRRLTRNLRADDGAPTWSPDGRMLAFASGRGGNTQIYVMSANGSGQRNLTRNRFYSDFPAWSPGGRTIAFISERGGNTDLYVMNADGNGQRRLTRGPASEYRPSWSPDGRRIAFTRSYDFAPSEIWVMNADGSGQRRLKLDEIEDVNYPAWAPDGRRIAFAGLQAGEYGIYVVKVNDTGERRLAHGRARHEFPAWSPNGLKIAFSAGRERTNPAVASDDIYVMNADGKNVRKLTDSSAAETQPAWQPPPRR